MIEILLLKSLLKQRGMIMKIKIDEIMNFYMDKTKNDSSSVSYEWIMILLAMLMFTQNENREVDIAEIEKIIPNIRKDMGLEE